MAKKKRSKIKTSKKLSSFEDDEKKPQTSKSQHGINQNQRTKVQCGSSHDRPTETDGYVDSSIKNDVHQIKKATYRLAQTSATGQKSASTAPYNAKSCSTQKFMIPGNGSVCTASGTVIMAPSNPLSNYSAHTAYAKTQNTSQIDLHNKKSHRRLSKCTKAASSDLKEQNRILGKRIKKHKNSDSPKTRNINALSSVAEELRKKRVELVRLKCRKASADSKTRQPLSRPSSISVPSKTVEQPNGRAKLTAPDKHFALPQGRDKTVSLRPPKRLLTQEEIYPTKIQKKAKLAHTDSTILYDIASKEKDGICTNVATGSEISGEKANVQGALCSQDVPDARHFERQNRTSKGGPQEIQQQRIHALSCYDQTKSHQERVDDDDEMMVVEVLHLVRNQNNLVGNAFESNGELSCMDIDTPEDLITDTLGTKPLQQDLIVVLDTNVLLSHLSYVKSIRTHGLGGMGFPMILIPWIVLQELNSLKDGRRLEHLARPAVHYIYSCLKSQEPRLWAQSMQHDGQSTNSLKAENNDDRVLLCCLQYQQMYPESAVILCSNDKNLCSKALVSGVKTISKADLELESQGTRCSPQPQLSTVGPAGTRGHTGSFCLEPSKQATPLCESVLGSCVSVLENCLKVALSEILEVEMKAAYEEIWNEIIYLKPPWSLPDVLHCLKKHWVAVFRYIANKASLQSVLNLIDYFNSGTTADGNATLKAVAEAQELLEAFGRRSSYSGHVFAALTSLDNILHQLQAQPVPKEGSSISDAAMSYEEERPGQSTVESQQAVWALFEHIWSRLSDLSNGVLMALHFDGKTIQNADPPQDAIEYLTRLFSMVTQLLQAFTRVLSPDTGLGESNALLAFIYATEISTIGTRVTAKELLDLLSVPEYMEKLRIGAGQLTTLKESLERCMEVLAPRGTAQS